MFHHNANGAGCRCIVLAFDLIQARTHIKVDPAHVTSLQLTKHINALDTISKLAQQCTLDAAEQASIADVRNMINAQIEALLEASDRKYDVSKLVHDLTTETKELLQAHGCEVFHTLPGEIHAKTIRQKELFAVNKILEAKYQTILLRSDW